MIATHLSAIQTLTEVFTDAYRTVKTSFSNIQRSIKGDTSPKRTIPRETKTLYNVLMETANYTSKTLQNIRRKRIPQRNISTTLEDLSRNPCKSTDTLRNRVKHTYYETPSQICDAMYTWHHNPHVHHETTEYTTIMGELLHAYKAL
jgi:hypothetical protein